VSEKASWYPSISTAYFKRFAEKFLPNILPHGSEKFGIRQQKQLRLIFLCSAQRKFWNLSTRAEPKDSQPIGLTLVGKFQKFWLRG
jgi:hypothetical protein